ncbi:MAG TPA: SDR family oxidoreductase [Limnochordia bacterium]
MHIDLTGRAAVVTGAAQGIGAATARRLAESGAQVLIADIQDEKGKRVAASIPNASYVHADVGDPEQVRRMIDTAADRYGRLDILVNNAHWEVRGAATEITAEDWDRTYAVLVRALFLGAKYAIEHMRRVGGGCIVNIASVLGHQPLERYVTYTSAKAAVIQLSRQLAIDYGPDGIRVVTVSPGTIITDERYAVEPDRESISARLMPLRRNGRPIDIANAICFLVSEQASYITGAELIVDGGLTLPAFSVFTDRMRRLLEEGDSPRR